MLYLARRSHRMGDSLKPENGASEQSDLAPANLGRYCDMALIAKRGLACAFEATDSRTNERVFLKILRESKLNDAHAFRLFCQESTLLQMIAREAAHIPIPPVLDVGYWHERPFFTQPFLTGWSLEKAMRKRTGFNGSSAISIIEGCLVFLNMLHDFGLAHGDLSPDNIFVKTDEPVAEHGSMPGRFSILLLDYNSSRRIDQQQTPTGEKNVVFLKLPYAAPELARGQPLSGQSDLYALGVLFFELLVGVRPHHDLKSMADVRKLWDANIPTIPAELGVPRQIEEFVRLLLEPNPARRFKSTAECYRAFQEISNVHKWLSRKDPIETSVHYYLPQSQDYFVQGSMPQSLAIPVLSEVGTWMNPKLVVINGSLKGKTFPLNVDEVSIGREAANVVSIRHPSLSRRHCVIRRDGNEFRVIDLDSYNGTFVNGIPIKDQQLAHSDQIRIGSIEVLFLLSEEDDLTGASPVRLDDSKTSQIPAHQSESYSHSISVEVSLAHDVAIPGPRHSEEGRRDAGLTEMFSVVREMMTLGAGSNLKSKFEKATEILFRSTPADRVAALLVNRSKSESNEDLDLSPIAIRTRDESSVAFGHEIARKVIKERISLLSHDASVDESFADFASVGSQGVRSIICAPIINETEVYGALYADRLDPFSSFKVEDLELIHLVAMFSAIMVENSRARHEASDISDHILSDVLVDRFAESLPENDAGSSVQPAISIEHTTMSPGRHDLVDFSVFAPCTVIPEVSFILEVWAYRREQRDEVLRRAGRHGGLIERGSRNLSLANDRTELTLVLRLDNFDLQDSRDTFLWSGDLTSITFIVRAPKNLKPGVYPGQISILHGGLLLTRLIFELTVGKRMEEQGTLNLQRQEFRSAFASYASSDRGEVLRRVQGIQATGMDVFLDVVSLRAGAYWEVEIFKHIRARDIFYLFWSSAARQSEWVNREWRYALEEKGLDFIHPIPLASPDEVPPPEELRSKHFNDMILACLKSQTVSAIVK